MLIMIMVVLPVLAMTSWKWSKTDVRESAQFQHQTSSILAQLHAKCLNYI